MTYENESQRLELLGLDDQGRPVYGHPLVRPLSAPTAPVQPQQYAAPVQAPQPLVQRPVGAGAGKWLAIGVGASVLVLSLALALVAVAVSVVALTVCALVLRAVWNDVRKER
jgi:hypothetical protein